MRNMPHEMLEELRDSEASREPARTEAVLLRFFPQGSTELRKLIDLGCVRRERNGRLILTDYGRYMCGLPICPITHRVLPPDVSDFPIRRKYVRRPHHDTALLPLRRREAHRGVPPQ